jgi:hypothetical protein
MYKQLTARHFKSHGFFVSENKDEKWTNLIEQARNLIDEALNDACPDKTYPTDKTSATCKKWIDKKSKIQSHPSILNLIDNSLIAMLEKMLGTNIQPVRSSQIAVRFPGEGTKINNNDNNNDNDNDNDNDNNNDSKENNNDNIDNVIKIKMHPNLLSSIHIDNFTQKDFQRKKLPGEFQLLVGIVIDDNLNIDHGNFTCFPGSHNQIRAWLYKKVKTQIPKSVIDNVDNMNNIDDQKFAIDNVDNMNNSDDVAIAQRGYLRLTNDAYKYLCDNGLTEMFNELKLIKSYQICAKAGSMIIADRMLAHLICSPNNSNDYIRKIVWFRIKSKNNNNPYGHLIRRWPVNEYNITQRAQRVAQRVAAPTAPTAALDEVSHRQPKGLPLGVEYGSNQRITQRAQRVAAPTAALDEVEQLEIEGRCYLDNVNAMNREIVLFAKPNMINHLPNMFASMVELKGSYEDNKFNLTKVHTCGFLSRESHQLWLNQLLQLNDLTNIVKTINDTDYKNLLSSWFKIPDRITNVVTAELTFHHIHSLAKTEMMKEWAKLFNIDVSIARGNPGIIFMKGEDQMIKEYVKQAVMRFHWSEKPIFKINS